MSLTTQIITGSQAAINLIKNYLANPSIAPSIEGLPKQDLAKAVVLECESYRETLPAEISQQMVVDINQGKNWISDNIAPKPRVWELKGYIGVVPYERISSPLMQAAQEKSIGYLREMYSSRKMLAFNVKNQTQTILVGMESLILDSDPLIQNRTPFTMTLKEIPIMSYNNTGNLAIPTGSENISSAAQTIGIIQAIGTGVAEVVVAVESLIPLIWPPAQSGKSIKFVYPIPIPSSGNGVLNFTFNARINGMIFAFNFKYTGKWNIYVTMPGGTIRDAALIPNVTQWSGYSDYSIYCQTDLANIGVNDLDKVSLYMVSF